MIPKVSVILSSYNHGKYISEAIESVLNQTFTDFELLIFDDSSSDNSREIIKTFTDSRIKFFLHEVNRGPIACLQECMEVTQGKYIAIHHSDDVWKPNKLEKQVDFLDTHQNYDACFTWVEIIDEDGNKYEISEKDNYHAVFDQENRTREKWLHDLFFSGNCFCHPSVLLRNKKNLHNEIYGVHGFWQLPDYTAWVRLLLQSDLYVITERLTLFRLRRKKQDNTSAERPDTVIRSEMELYRALKEYRRITDSKVFLEIFPEAKKYVVNEKILPQYALAKILQTSNSAARKLLALDILFDLLNNEETAKILLDLYNYDEKIFAKENATAGIIYPETKLNYADMSLYYDTGEGFLEKNKIQSAVYIKRDGNFFVEFSLDEAKNIKTLRFDPAENELVALKILSLKINDEEVKFSPGQPFKESGGYQIFFTKDPKYFLSYSGTGKISVQIFGNFSNDYNALEILNAVNAEKNNLAKNFTDIENQKNSLEQTLNEIYSSRAYKFIKKYYYLRDKLLPPGSMRRTFIKNFAWAVLNPKLVLGLMNKENLAKAYTAWKNGGLRQVMTRINTKIKSSSVANVNQAKTIQYGNAWLEQKEIYFPPENVTVDILIPIYNAYDFTKKCIASVYENTDVSFNLFLINDRSSDERIKILLDEVSNMERPTFMRDLKILNNEKNLGFIGTVNHGFDVSKNDVVILNTDTEVPPNWLSRLIKPMLDDEKIASVTPFSNSAEICSFPNFCQNNDLPEGLTVSEVDKIFSRYGDSRPCEIPTGVGFCMLMRRECIEKCGKFDKVFGAGYGEENDWCQRTLAQGYKHVHVRNLFVWHKHGASFAERTDKSKQQRLKENLAILAERYPEYHQNVAKYIQQDPAKENRNFLKFCAEAVAGKNIQGVIFINHSMGGGTKVYQNNLIAELKDSWRVYSLELLADKITLTVKNCNTDQEENIISLNLQNMHADLFRELMNSLNINWIYINQLVTYPIPDILNWITKSEVPYTFFGHDFFAACPHYQLLNNKMKYCNAETDPEICTECLKKSKNLFSYSVDIMEWRKNFKTFLENAKEIIVPSENTKEILKKYYPLDIKVREHKVSPYLSRTFRSEFAEENNLTVAVVGSIGDEKGSKIIYSLAEKIERDSLPINLIVIGITNLHNENFCSKGGKFKITGGYSNKEISALLAKYKIGLVLIPSIWPETYSYTTAEAMNSGYPVMVFSIGAPADRVRRTGGGWILEEISADSVLNKLSELLNNRNEILKQAEKL